jgi:hypothetical protein
MGMACSTHGEERNAYRILDGMARERRPLGGHSHRQEDNIKMNVR